MIYLKLIFSFEKFIDIVAEKNITMDILKQGQFDHRSSVKLSF